MTPTQIRTLRKKLTLSPEVFATALGFAGEDRRITLWRWEKGKRKPSPQTVLLMKGLLHRFKRGGA
jgi:DNA-binding transcriptional regulator YiaG